MMYKYRKSDKHNTVTMFEDKAGARALAEVAVQQSLCWLTRASTNLRQVLFLPRSVQAGFLTLPRQLAPPHLHVPFSCQLPCAVADFQLMNVRMHALLLLPAGSRNPANQSSIFLPLVSLVLTHEYPRT